METIKAGCILIDKDTKKVAIIYRKNADDYSFPKGHLEKNETIEECAIRETAEETKRNAVILKEYEPYVERYVTPSGERCVCYMFLALDDGPSDNKSLDTHETLWINFDKVEEVLSYPSLKKMWNEVSVKIG